MNGDDADDAKRAERRKRDAASARRRRADRRAAREAAWDATLDDAAATQNVVDDAQAAGATTDSATQSVSGTVVHLPIRHSSLLDEHIRRAARYLALLEADKTVSILEKTRLFVASIPALAKGIEAVELRDRLEALERRADARDRRGRW